MLQKDKNIMKLNIFYNRITLTFVTANSNKTNVKVFIHRRKMFGQNVHVATEGTGLLFVADNNYPIIKTISSVSFRLANEGVTRATPY